MSDELPVFFQQDPFLRRRLNELGIEPRALLEAMHYLGMSDLVQQRLILIGSYTDLMDIIVHSKFLKEHE